MSIDNPVEEIRLVDQSDWSTESAVRQQLVQNLNKSAKVEVTFLRAILIDLNLEQKKLFKWSLHDLK